jgi:predicted ArsR family transcriptional regulator
MDEGTRRSRVDRFILEQIDSVPHLEGLLLLFNSRPKAWSADEMAKSLYVRNDVALKILENLQQRSLIAVEPPPPNRFLYSSADEARNKLMEDVDAVYRKEIVRVSSLIHSKASPAVRDFARAFRLKKEENK